MRVQKMCSDESLNWKHKLNMQNHSIFHALTDIDYTTHTPHVIDIRVEIQIEDSDTDEVVLVIIEDHIHTQSCHRKMIQFVTK